MDAKLRDDLFRRYAAFLERRVEEGAGSEGAAGARGAVREEALIATATALLGACEAEGGQHFRLVRFYHVVENSLRTLRGANLRALEGAFATLETVCTNLLLFPWKKEFRCIKTFTGPYVYQLQSALCEPDLRSLLRSMGYARDQDHQYVSRDPASPAAAHHLRQLAFELLLAQAECRLLRGRGAGVSELDAVATRRGPAEPERERAPTPARRAGRPSKSVDVTDGAGHWHRAHKPVLKASLSLRKEPPFAHAEDDPRDEILRPARLATPEPHPYPYPYHLSSLDEIDLYTERGAPAREPWEPWLPGRGHALKCQGCGSVSQTLSSCQSCDAILCPPCHASDPPPCCGFRELPKGPRPLDGHVAVKDKLSVYSGAHTHPHPDKPALGAKLYPTKGLGLGLGAPPPGTAGSRCGFCNKPGAAHTCVNCSKVSCDSCVGLYMGDVCTRKSLHHNFVPNHQLNYKSSTISHLVYR